MTISKRAALNMMDGYAIEPGPTLADKLGARISDAWQEYYRLEGADYSQTETRGVITGLALALGTIRYAPATPTPEQIEDIAQEFNLL